nr:HNH endonuclease signature motif containing protein [Micromonospora sp. DSM 115978]
DDQPGHLVGHGPVPAELARRLAGHAHWRRILYDPADDSLVEVAARRHATTGHKRHVHVRDLYCQHPGCPRLAADCDTDHTQPHHHGGPTHPDNLTARCRRHHRLKDEDTGWHTTQDQHGHTTTTPTGRTYTHHPEHPWNPHPDTDPGTQPATTGHDPSPARPRPRHRPCRPDTPQALDRTGTTRGDPPPGPDDSRSRRS